MQAPKKYFIVTGVYNAEKFIGRCIASVSSQNIPEGVELIHLIIDDGSKDRTAEIIKNTCNGQVVITQEKNLGPIASQLAGFEYARKNGSKYDVIIQLDGDDWLHDETVLITIHKTYLETQCGATYGNWVGTRGSESNCRVPDWDNLHNDLKYNGWCFSHLRTFRTGYTAYLSDEDMRDPDDDNNYYVSAYDAVIYLPIAEMAGRDRVKMINKPLVTYNQGNPQSDGRIRYFDQTRCAYACYAKPERIPVAL